MTQLLSTELSFNAKAWSGPVIFAHMLRRWRRSSILVFTFIVALGLSENDALSVPFDPNDLVLAGYDSDTISVNGANDCHFKGNLVGGFDKIRGLDFDAFGDLVAVGSTSVRVFDSAGGAD